ncbi:MAG: hypothetical protein NZ951_06210 [Dehalococcoidia bacterium]|nr:hypothetical protein [Dehalococcoidia bacterium]MDW8119985.1 hypothetical protein [Chloroflexota bacterium]
MHKIARGAPPLTLIGPEGPAMPGQPVLCTVNLALPRAYEVRAVRVEVWGVLRRVVGSLGWGPLRLWRWATERVIRTHHALPIGHKLGPGTASYRLEVPLPADAPPTARGRMLQMVYTLRARLDIPHAPDRWEVAPLRVHTSPPPWEGLPPSPREESISVRLEAPRTLVAGQRVQGSLALVASHPVVLNDLRLDLVQRERVPPREWAFTVGRVAFPSVSLGAYAERVLSFSLGIPPQAPPTCVLPHHCSIQWSLRLTARGYPRLAEVSVVVGTG